MTFVIAMLGGALIGLSSGILFISLGKVAGVSGISRGAFWELDPWRVAFVLGLVVAGFVFHQFEWLEDTAGIGGPIVLVAGLLVGIGVRVANGCTSGHGVCGVARLSPRSIVATVTFISAGGAVMLLRGVL